MATRSATRIRTCAAALLLALFVLTAPAGAAEAQPTVLSSSTDSFVPDHGGEDDSARLDVRVPSGARYTVVVRTRDGHTVRVLHNGWLRKGTAQVFWDGRSDAGDVLEPGNYRIHVRRGSSNIATAPVVVRAPRVSVWGLSTGRAYIAGHNRAPAILARYRLNAAASVSAAVVRADGVVVRTLVSGSQARGKRSLHWNGRTNTGVYAPDGSYTIMINASGGGFPSGTLRLPVRVDRTAPVVRARAGRLAARTQSTGLFVRVPISLSERSTVIASARRGRTWRATVNPGRRVLKIRASDVGISQGRRARTWRLRITARDATTNTGSAVLSVAVAGRPRPAQPSTPAPPPSTTGGYGWPSRGVVTSEFGPRWGRNHQGIDIAAPTGTPAVASRGGIVSFAGTQSGYGNIVIIEHPGGVTTAYAHMSRITVVAGDTVARGERIGDVGNTGRSTGSHMHFEIRVNGIARNPRLYLKGDPARV